MMRRNNELSCQAALEHLHAKINAPNHLKVREKRFRTKKVSVGKENRSLLPQKKIPVVEENHLQSRLFDLKQSVDAERDSLRTVAAEKTAKAPETLNQADVQQLRRWVAKREYGCTNHRMSETEFDRSFLV